MAIVVGAATLWVLFSAWLLLLQLDAPRALVRTVAVLGWIEFVALLGWGAAVPTQLASEEVPALTVGVLAAGALHGLGIGRRTPG